MEQLKKDLKSKNFNKCYLFYGNESYLKRAYENSFKKAIIDKDAEIMNLDIFEDKKVPVNTILDAMETLPFMSEKRLVIVKDSGLFQTGRKDESEKMTEYINNISESSCIIFVEDEIDKRGKLYKAVAKFGCSVEFKTPDEKGLIKWITLELKKNKLSISSSAALYLIRTVGGSMDGINSEISKLSAFKYEGSEITNLDIDEVCIKSFETKIFDLVAGIGNKKPEIALEIYRNLLLSKEPPIKILAMIIRQFRLIFQCKNLLGLGQDMTGISQRLGQRDFVIRECIKQSKNFSMDIIRKAFESCLNTDIGIKTGKISDELGVEMLIVEFGSMDSRIK